MNATDIAPFDRARAGLGNVRITGLETIPLRVPFSSPFRIAAGGAWSDLEVLVVRLTTNEGIVGIGETQAWRRQGSVETIASLKAAIDDHFAPQVLGKSPFAMARIMADMDRALDKSLYAKAPISDALYDLQGKLLGVPVHDLLGGKCRDTVIGCAVLAIKGRWEETLEGARQFHERGFRSFTIKIGLDPKEDLRNVRGIRENFPDAIIRVDANAGMGFDAALALLKRIERYDIDAAEQLLAMWDVAGMAELARRVDIPLMADECVATDHDLLDVISRRAATVVQTKIAKNGGIWRCRKLWTIAAAADMRIYPGNHPCTSIGSAAVAHMAAAWSGELLDGPFAVGITGALRNDIVTEPLRVEGAKVFVPHGPGLGVTLCEDAVRAMRMDA